MTLSVRGAATLGLITAFFVFALKLVAWWLTDSVALMSDALETVVNIAASGLALWAIRQAERPPDQDHAYGHDKVEYFAVALESLLIVAAAAGVAYAAVERLISGGSPGELGVGLILAAVAAGINGGVAWVIGRVGRRGGSPALVADSRHLWSDVVTTVGALSGLLAAKALGWWLLDPLIALAVAAHIAYVGWGLFLQWRDGLMDATVDQATLDLIVATLDEHSSGALEWHGLRTRRAGRRVFVDVHLVVPGAMTVATSHGICDRIEAALEGAVPGADATIHVEPEAEAVGQGAPQDGS